MTSELLASTGGGETNAEDAQKLVGHLTVSMLSGIASAKEGAPTNSEQGTWLQHQITLNATVQFRSPPFTFLYCKICMVLKG